MKDEREEIYEKMGFRKVCVRLQDNDTKAPIESWPVYIFLARPSSSKPGYWNVIFDDGPAQKVKHIYVDDCFNNDR